MHLVGGRAKAAPGRHETGVVVKAVQQLLRRAHLTLHVRSVVEKKINQIHEQIDRLETYAKNRELIVQCLHADDVKNKTYRLASVDKTEEEVRSLTIDIKSHEGLRGLTKTRMPQKLPIARSRQLRMSLRRKQPTRTTKFRRLAQARERLSSTSSKPMMLTEWPRQRMRPPRCGRSSLLPSPRKRSCLRQNLLCLGAGGTVCHGVPWWALALSGTLRVHWTNALKTAIPVLKKHHAHFVQMPRSGLQCHTTLGGRSHAGFIGDEHQRSHRTA